MVNTKLNHSSTWFRDTYFDCISYVWLLQSYMLQGIRSLLTCFYECVQSFKHECMLWLFFTSKLEFYTKLNVYRYLKLWILWNILLFTQTITLCYIQKHSVLVLYSFTCPTLWGIIWYEIACPISSVCGLFKK
jgi:hypothetical protein